MARPSDPKKLALWQGRFRRFLDSGLAVARFCAIEHVSESSFYYWQKKLGPRALRRPTRVDSRGACAEDRNVFQPVTVMPTRPAAACGVLVRLPGGTRIEIGAAHLDAIRAVVAETVRVDRGWEANRRSPSTCRADHEHGGAASC